MIRDTSQMDQAVEPAGPRRRRRWLFPLITAALALLVFANLPTLSRWAAAERSVDRSRLRFATVSRGELIHEIGVQGRVVAASRPTLFSPAAGLVSLRVREGEDVQQGDVLAQLSSPELESRLRQERASHEALVSNRSRLRLSIRQQNLVNEQRIQRLKVEEAAARREVKRSTKLKELGLLNEIELETDRDALTVKSLELDQAQSSARLEREMLEFELEDATRRLERQQLIVEDLERQVDELSVRSPFGGLVATVTVEDQDAVVRGQPLLGVVDLSDLELEIAIPEAYADEVAIGNEAVIRQEGQTIAGTLVRVAPEVRDGQVEGRVAFTGGPPSGLRQNQRLSTRLVLDQREDVLRLRRGPFLESLGGRHVYRVREGLATLTPVQLGALSVTEVEIVDGLSEGDEVVLSDLSRFDGAEALLIRD